MEVQHHPEVEKKGLKEYVPEGLMIFIAVMMSFIAENVREDYTEHKKADAYAITMVADVASDTVQLNDYIAYYNFARMNTDTLMKLLSKTSRQENYTCMGYSVGVSVFLYPMMLLFSK